MNGGGRRMGRSSCRSADSGCGSRLLRGVPWHPMRSSRAMPQPDIHTRS
ncbi:hypothetical protein [Azospirillum argentinense]